MEQTVEETVQKVREHTDDILDDLDKLDDETIFEDDEFFDSPSDTSEIEKEESSEAAADEKDSDTDASKEIEL